MLQQTAIPLNLIAILDVRKEVKKHVYLAQLVVDLRSFCERCVDR
jgi:hypothetical protein